jgi:SAM-dependent methyltransferase
MPRLRTAPLAIGLILTLILPLARAQTPPAQKPALRPARAATAPDGPKVYMGREIAPVMTFHGADWLVRDTREAEEQPEKMLDALKIQPGMTVADVGAGVGYTSLKIARRVGPRGTVLATDVQPEMLRMLAQNARDFGVKNIKPILCTATDPKLPENSVDLILMIDVYHELSEPETALKGLRKALKPSGRMVLVEFRAEDPEVPIKPEHKMSVAQARKELEGNGFAFAESLEFLPWQHIIIFNKKPDPPKPPAEAEAKKAEPAPK